MFGSIQTYLNAVGRTWHAQDGLLVSTFLSVRDRHALNHHLYIEHPENVVGRILDPPVDEIIVEHLKVLYNLSRSRKSHRVERHSQQQQTLHITNDMALFMFNFCTVQQEIMLRHTNIKPPVYKP